jgi:hypothetical protein
MKSKILKILGVVLTLSLFASIGLAGAVVADVSQPTVTVDNDDLSAWTDYVVLFQVTEAVPTTGTITIEFPAGTDANIVADADVNIQTTAGFGAAQLADVGTDSVWDADDLTVTITLTDLTAVPTGIGEFAMVKVEFVNCIQNPGTPGDYTLFVETSEETTAVESAVYEIGEITPTGRPGIVEVINDAGYTIDITYGDTAIMDAMAIADEGFTIEVGPGTYNGEALDAFVVVWDDLTIEATSAAADTIWTGGGVVINGVDDVIISGLTFEGDVVTNATDLLIEDCIFTDPDGGSSLAINGGDGDIVDCVFDSTPGATDDVGIDVMDAGWDIEDCEFMLDEDDHGILTDMEVDITGCTFTGSSGVGVEILDGAVDVTGCSFDGTDVAVSVFDIDGAGIDAIISGCEIMNCVDEAIVVAFSVIALDDVTIFNNTFSGNEDDLLLVTGPAMGHDVLFTFNNLEDGGTIDNDAADGDVYAMKNYWGGDEDNEGDVMDTPVLGAPVVDAVVEQDDDTVSGLGITLDLEDMTDVEFAGVAQLQKAPGPLPSNQALGAFYDLLVYDNAPGGEAMIRISNAAVDDNSRVQVFTELAGKWLTASDQGVNAFSGYVWFTVDDMSVPNLDELIELPIVLVQMPPTKGTMDLNSPVGDSELSNVPFTWDKVSGAVEYTFVLSASPELTEPLVETTTTATAYQYTGTLSDGVSYFWQVTASDGEFIIGESGIGAFVAQAPMEPEDPPVINIEAPPAPNVTIEQPAAETPMYIWIIIGIGALLLIFVIILIMRTRRAV